MKKLLLICYSIIFAIMINSAYGTSISDYQRVFIPLFDDKNNLQIALRSFKRDGVSSFLLVDINTLKTTVKPANLLTTRKMNHHEKSIIRSESNAINIFSLAGFNFK